MPNWISDEGKWYPAKESVVLINRSNETIKNPSADYSQYAGQDVTPGSQYIYEGPCRAALFDLFLNDEECKGINFKHDPEMIKRVKMLGFKNMEEYAKMHGHDPVKAKKRFEELCCVVSKHELPRKVSAHKVLGGGKDLSGQGKHEYGGFGDPPATAKQ